MSAPEDNLPPVQPPSAGFLMQLFVVPMVIVVVIVMVCLMFNWLAHSGSNPERLVDDLANLNAGSWQSALTVANLLTDRQNAELRQNADMAQKLAAVLDQQLDESDREPEGIKLRVYLCQALGVFEIDEGRETLMRAAGPEGGDAESEVRKAALEALAQRAGGSAEIRETMQSDPRMLEVLNEAASSYSDQPGAAERAAQVRERAAYALGVLGGESSLELLASLTADAEPSVRYNAATGLARHGDVRAVPRLVEMIKSPQTSGPNESARAISEPEAVMIQTVIIRNGLRAAAQLADAGVTAEALAPLRQAVDQLGSDESVDSNLRRGIDADLRVATDKLPPAS